MKLNRREQRFVASLSKNHQGVLFWRIKKGPYAGGLGLSRHPFQGCSCKQHRERFILEPMGVGERPVSLKTQAEIAAEKAIRGTWEVIMERHAYARGWLAGYRAARYRGVK